MSNILSGWENLPQGINSNSTQPQSVKQGQAEESEPVKRIIDLLMDYQQLDEHDIDDLTGQFVQIFKEWHNSLSSPQTAGAVWQNQMNEAKQPDCSQHKKDLFGKTDMKEVAEAIGNLHYKSLIELFDNLHSKFILDAAKDRAEGRGKIANMLESLAESMTDAAIQTDSIYDLCKPYMNETGAQ